MQLRTQRAVDNYVGRLGIAALRPAAMLLGWLLRRDHRLTVGREVVWIKMLGGGSLIIAMPMLLGFRRAHPNVKMVLVTTPSVRPFAELLGVFDEYRIIDTRGGLRVIGSAVVALFRTLRADCIVDLEVHSRLTTVFTTLSLARNRVSFWLEDIFWRRGLASHLVFFNRSSASYHFYDRIADLFGVSIADQATCREALVAACEAAIVQPPTPGQVCVGFACSELGQERMLSAAQWVEVARANLRPEHTTLALLGSPGDRTKADQIIVLLDYEFPQSGIQEPLWRTLAARICRHDHRVTGVLGNRLESAALRENRRPALRVLLGADRSCDTSTRHLGHRRNHALPQGRVFSMRPHE